MNKGLQRKLKIENLTRCMNCSVFMACREPLKEDVVDCDHFVEIPDKEQVIVIGLCEWTKGKS